jgi:hypothetical protein
VLGFIALMMQKTFIYNKQVFNVSDNHWVLKQATDAIK